MFLSAPSEGGWWYYCSISCRIPLHLPKKTAKMQEAVAGVNTGLDDKMKDFEVPYAQIHWICAKNQLWLISFMSSSLSNAPYLHKKHLDLFLPLRPPSIIERLWNISTLFTGSCFRSIFLRLAMFPCSRTILIFPADAL